MFMKFSLLKKKIYQKNFKILTNIFSYLNFHVRNLKDKTKIKIKNERKIKTSIQGRLTLIKIHWIEDFWKKICLNLD